MNPLAGRVVKVRGEQYRVTGSRDAGASGSRWFGMRVYELERLEDGSRWECLARNVVAWNARLYPARVR